MTAFALSVMASAVLAHERRKLTSPQPMAYSRNDRESRWGYLLLIAFRFSWQTQLRAGLARCTLAGVGRLKTLFQKHLHYSGAKVLIFETSKSGLAQVFVASTIVSTKLEALNSPVLFKVKAL